MPIAMLPTSTGSNAYKEHQQMYLHNKYCLWYYTIIQQAQSRTSIPEVIEKHHIIPKSLGGTNDSSNLVSLTPREHYICHLLLTKMCEGKARQKMIYALWAIMNLCNKYQERKVIRGRLYESLRQEYIQSQKDKAGPNHPNRGVKRLDRTKDSFTPEWKARISAAKKGKPTWNKGINHTEETRALQSLIARSRVKKECPHCKKVIAGPSNFTRWHNDNCKSKN